MVHVPCGLILELFLICYAIENRVKEIVDLKDSS